MDIHNLTQHDLTEDEAPAHSEADITVNDTAHNDSDGTVSEGDEPHPTHPSLAQIDSTHAEEDTEVEASDVSDDEQQECRCNWEGCVETAETPALLTAHALHEHIDNKAKPGESKSFYHCHWADCAQTASIRYRMVCHVRKHTNDVPFHCFVPTCPESFVDAIELSTHLVNVHNENRLDNFEWLTQIDQIKLDKMQPLPKKELRSIKRVTRMTERELARSLTTPKVDFLKIQNVTVDDIVTEPLKKKGRTANADINANLREDYKSTNNVLKDRIMEAAKESFAHSSQVEGMPSYTEIDSMKLDSLQLLHSQLERKLLWSLEVNELLNEDLAKLKEEEHKLWAKKELALDSTIMLELPEEFDTYVP